MWGWGGGGTGPRSQQGRRGKPANIIVKFFFFLFFRIFIYNLDGEAGVTEVSRLRAPPPSPPQQSPSSRFTSLKYYYKYYEIRQG